MRTPLEGIFIFFLKGKKDLQLKIRYGQTFFGTILLDLWKSELCAPSSMLIFFLKTEAS